MNNRDVISKAEVLDIYAELYDEFDDAQGIIKVLHRVYDKINNLKEQEPLVINKCGFTAQCPECRTTWMMWQPDNMRYCPGCGRQVKWDDSNRNGNG